MNKRSIKKILVKINILRTIPAYVLYHISKNKNIINLDLKKWKEALGIDDDNSNYLLGYLLLFHKEFRNLFYNRLQKYNPMSARLIKFLYPELESLHIVTKNIGGGLFIQHGFSTIIAAKSIGSNCWINQQVTIGYSNKIDAPVIGDNVRITAGAKVIGNVKLETNCIVGANAVVVKDVPQNAVVGGIPAKIIKYQTNKELIKL